MTLFIPGNIRYEEIILPNGMRILIEYGMYSPVLKEFSPSGERYFAKCRRVTLFDVDGEIISQLLEENPDKEDLGDDPYGVKNIPPNVLF